MLFAANSLWLGLAKYGAKFLIAHDDTKSASSYIACSYRLSTSLHFIKISEERASESASQWGPYKVHSDLVLFEIEVV